MHWIAIAPELFMLLTAILFLFLSLTKTAVKRDFRVALVTGAIALVLGVLALKSHSAILGGTIRIDFYSQVFKLIILAGFFLIVCLCGSLGGINDNRHSEFYLILAVCTLSMMMLVGSVHLLSLYISLEISSYSLYILTYLRKGDRSGLEAGIRFFIVGSVASAIMLIGFVLLYSMAHTADLEGLKGFIQVHVSTPLVLVGLIFSLSGFMFKLAVFPFHFWAPDVYQNAPHQVSAYIATVSKVAAIAVLLRLTGLPGGLSRYFTDYLMLLALVTMTVGNLAAVVQTDFKRLLAFSSIAHAGYIMIGLLSQNRLGQQGIVFYAVSILVMKYTCFLVLVMVAKDGRNIRIDELAGLHRRSPLLAAALLLALFGLAGIPPTIGFSAKFLIFMAAMKENLLILVILAMVNVVISLYYYLHVLKAAYFTRAAQKPAAAIRLSVPQTAIVLLLILTIVILGIYANPLVQVSAGMFPFLSP